MGEAERIKRLAAYYKRIYGTSDLFEIADRLGVLYQIGKAKYDGCYMFLKNHRYIFLSDELDDAMLRLVIGHELGPAVLDRKQNCYFIREKRYCLIPDSSGGQTCLWLISLSMMACYRTLPDAQKSSSANARGTQRNHLI